MAQVEPAVPVATADACSSQGSSVPSGTAYLRCQFPRNPRRSYDRKGAEADARTLAALWLAIPAAERTADRLKQEAQASGLETRIEQVDEVEGLEAARLAPWLTLVRAPCRVFLLADADIWRSAAT
jgi:hypothetical protein